MFRTRLAMRLVGSRPLGGLRLLGGPKPLGGLRFVNQEAKQPIQPTTQLIKEPTKGTKDRLDNYKREVPPRTNFATLKAGMPLLGWELLALNAAFVALYGVIFYKANKLDKHLPAAIVAILIEKNLVRATPPPNPTTEAPALAPALPAKVPAGK